MYLKIHFTRLKNANVEVMLLCQNPGDYPHPNIFPSPMLIDPSKWENLNGGWEYTGKVFTLRSEAEAYAVKVIDRARKLYADFAGIYVPQGYGVVIQ